MATFQTTVCSYTVRRTAKMSEQAKSTIGYLSNSWASC